MFALCVGPPTPRAVASARSGPRYDCSSLLGGCCLYLTRWQTLSDSKSSHRDPPTLCPVCGDVPTRGQDLRRHILSVHLPDWICCPHSDCSWRGSRKDVLYKHLKDSDKKCGSLPESVEQYTIYDTELTLRSLLIDCVPFETVETFVLGWIEERARELNKIDVWGPLTNWRKLMSQVLVGNV